MTEELHLPNLERWYRGVRRNRVRPDGLPYSKPAKELRERTRCTPEGLVYRLMHYPRISGLVSFGGRFYEWSEARHGWQRMTGDLWWVHDLGAHLRFEAANFREDAAAALREGVAPTVDAVFEHYRLMDYAYTIEETASSLSRHAPAIVRGLHKHLSPGVDRMPAPILPTEAEWIGL